MKNDRKMERELTQSWNLPIKQAAIIHLDIATWRLL
jgi:hypothetical protein